MIYLLNLKKCEETFWEFLEFYLESIFLSEIALKNTMYLMIKT